MSKTRTSYLGVEVPAWVQPQVSSGLSIVSLSAVLQVKRLDRIIDALALLGGSHPGLQIEWTHIGDGPQAEAVRAAAAAVLPANVEVTFAGQLSHDDALALLDSRQFDLIINSSESEGIPVSLMEAMARGIPALAPDIGGVSELVNDGHGCLMSGAPDPVEIASFLREFLKRSDRSGLSQAAHDHVDLQFNRSRNYRLFIDSVLSSPSAGAEDG